MIHVLLFVLASMRPPWLLPAQLSELEPVHIERERSAVLVGVERNAVLPFLQHPLPACFDFCALLGLQGVDLPNLLASFHNWGWHLPNSDEL
ncbi:hypothetical protein B0H11DRAFT_2035050 [Mycena galericulata]|nr:hypothetical protein B0H11DRAFT_2035050 [Mycena galericulata]